MNVKATTLPTTIKKIETGMKNNTTFYSYFASHISSFNKDKLISTTILIILYCSNNCVIVDMDQLITINNVHNLQEILNAMPKEIVEKLYDIIHKQRESKRITKHYRAHRTEILAKAKAKYQGKKNNNHNQISVGS